MVFIGNTHLDLVPDGPAARTRRSPGPICSTSSDSLLILAALLSFPLARRTRLERWKFVLDAAMVLVGGAVRDLVLLDPPHGGRQRRQQPGRHAARLRLPAGEHAGAARHHHGAAAPADRRQPAWPSASSSAASPSASSPTSPSTSCPLETGGRSASWIDGVYLLCYVMLIASAELYCRRPVPRAGPRARRRAPAHPAGQSAALPRGRHHLRAPAAWRCSSPGPTR